MQIHTSVTKAVNNATNWLVIPLLRLHMGRLRSLLSLSHLSLPNPLSESETLIGPIFRQVFEWVSFAWVYGGRMMMGRSEKPVRAAMIIKWQKLWFRAVVVIEVNQVLNGNLLVFVASVTFYPRWKIKGIISLIPSEFFRNYIGLNSNFIKYIYFFISIVLIKKEPNLLM